MANMKYIDDVFLVVMIMKKVGKSKRYDENQFLRSRINIECIKYIDDMILVEEIGLGLER